MQETITIEGNRPVEILDGLKSIEVLKEWSILDNTRTRFEVVFNIPQPTFSVGMRVMSIGLDWNCPDKCFSEKILYFTKDMVYRISGESANSFIMINDKGMSVEVPKEIFKDLFTPYEKPEMGDEYWYIYYGGVKTTIYNNFDIDKNLWNLGLAFKEEKQAEFARERLSKLF